MGFITLWSFRKKCSIFGLLTLCLGAVCISITGHTFQRDMDILDSNCASAFDCVEKGYEAQLRNELPLAESCFKAALLKPGADISDILFRLGTIMHIQNRDQEAADFYYRSWECNPGNIPHSEMAFNMELYLGAAADSVGNDSFALLFFERALRINNHDRDLWERYAEVLENLNRRNEAIKAKTIAAKLPDETREVENQMGRIPENELF